MRTVVAAALSVAALALAPLSCSVGPVSCEASCERAATACGGRASGCANVCRVMEDVSAQFGCSAEYQDLIDCDASQDPALSCDRDTCPAFPAWNDCMLRACNAATKACRLLGCVDGRCSTYGEPPKDL